MRHPAARLLGTLVLICTAAACQIGTSPSQVETSADTTAGEIPFELAGRGGAALTVPVHVNGQGPFPFVLDTGATLTCVDASLAERLALPEEQGQVGFGAGPQGSGPMRLVGVDSLRLGSVTAHDLTACTLDLQSLEQGGLEVEGLVGLNFLKEFRVTLDFGRNALELQPL